MADLKISQLSAATALAGTEVVPVVQGGSTKKATIDQILAPASGKGIDFSAAGGDTLTIYDEGTWTPTDASGAGLTFTTTYAKYIRVGKVVTVNMFITFPSTASAAQANIGGLPFNVASNNYPPVALASNSGVALSGIAAAFAKNFTIGTAADYSSAVANLTLSGRNLVASLTYLVD